MDGFTLASLLVQRSSEITFQLTKPLRMKPCEESHCILALPSSKWILQSKKGGIQMRLLQVAVPPDVTNAEPDKRRFRISGTLAHSDWCDSTKMEHQVTKIVDVCVEKRGRLRI